ncbi:anti-sigma factor family protein [Acidobacteriota bacterium]
MKCKTHREQIVLYLYGDLTEKEKAELEDHIKGCPECAADLAYTQDVFRILDDTKVESVPEADWDRCWSTINTNITDKVNKHERKKLFLLPGWAYAGASLVLIFVLGIAIGRFWLPSRSQTTVADVAEPTTEQQIGVTPQYAQQSLNDHFEDLKPLLVEYANYTNEGNGKEMGTLDKEALKNLLIQNYLLKKIVAESNPSALEILEDLDLVLREIKNQRSDDKSASSLIKGLIQERDILFKMDVLKTI